MIDLSEKQNNNLNNKVIVVTRPNKQATAIAKMIEKVGGCAFLYPLIEITPLNDTATLNKLSTLDTYDLIIFISVNAVKYCSSHIDIKSLEGNIIATTGKKTADELAKHDLKVSYCPDAIFNSEALLSIEAFKKSAMNKSIAIIRGSNGRDYLKDELLKLDAKVDYIDVYIRHCPQQNLQILKAKHDRNPIDALLLTSASSTENFFNLAHQDDVWINELTLVVGSARMQDEIPEGFKGKLLIATDPSDETLFEALLEKLN